MSLSHVANLLHSTYKGQDAQFVGCSIDTRTLRPSELFIALRGERFDGHDFIENAARCGASGAVVDKPCTAPLPTIVVDDTHYAMTKLAYYWRRRFPIPLVAITGSNGKTTVKEMVAAIFAQDAPVLATHGSLNNDIGVPITLFGLGSDHRYAVIEMGANHPGEIAELTKLVAPNVALITQCAPAHLEGFGSVEGVAHSKAEIFRGVDSGGTAIINGDDVYADLWRQESRHSSQLVFGLDGDYPITAKAIRLQDEQTTFTLVTPQGTTNITLNLPGVHNVRNALAAAAVAHSLGLSLAVMRRGLESVTAVTGRLQIKKGIKSCRIIDDTHNANPTSLNAALTVLSGLAGRHWLALGDMAELGQDAERLHHEAGLHSRAAGVERLYALGALTRSSVEAFGRGAKHFNSHAELAAALQDAVDEDVVVLVKGSRASRMECLVQALVTEH